MNFFTIFTLSILTFSTQLFAFHHVRSYYKEQPPLLQRTYVSHNQPKLDIEVIYRNFKKSDKKKVIKAVEILKRVLNSKDFKQRVLNFTFNGTRQFYQNNGMSNLEIYELIMSGQEVLKPIIDHKMNFDLTLYRSWNPFSKVKGYTLPDTLRIWIHKKFFRRSSWTPVDVAANMAHEWVHKIGFGHDYYYTDDRPYSVPYAIGNIVGDIANLMGYE